MRLFRKQDYTTCYKEYDFFWKTFCKISKEAALYEKIYQYLRDNYNRDFDIEGTIELTNDELTLLYDWLINKTLFVLSSSSLYLLTSIEMVSDNIHKVKFTKVYVEQ